MAIWNYKDIEIIYEDNHLLVVNKPAGLLTQGDITQDDNLLDLMKEYIRVEYNKPGQAFLALVHRLDRVTAGIVVFAKTSKCASRLSDQIRRRIWKKGYLAITDQNLRPKRGRLEDYLVKNNNKNMSYVTNVQNKNAKKALLDYRVLQDKHNRSLVDINLITGRSHQIRVQLANQRAPLYGDQRYNPEAKPNEEIALFAYKLEIEHPTLKKKMLFELEKPQRFPWNMF